MKAAQRKREERPALGAATVTTRARVLQFNYASLTGSSWRVVYLASDAKTDSSLRGYQRNRSLNFLLLAVRAQTTPIRSLPPFLPPESLMPQYPILTQSPWV